AQPRGHDQPPGALADGGVQRAGVPVRGALPQAGRQEVRPAMNPDSRPPLADEDAEVYPGPESLRVWNRTTVGVVAALSVSLAYIGLSFGAEAADLRRSSGVAFAILSAVLGGALGLILGVKAVRWRLGRGIRTVDEDLPTGSVPPPPAPLPRSWSL